MSRFRLLKREQCGHCDRSRGSKDAKILIKIALEEKISTFYIFRKKFKQLLFEDYPDLRDIVSLKYLNNERLHERHDGKGIRYDLLCQTSRGHRFIVEMQKNEQRHFYHRAIYYVSRAISEQGFHGKNELGVEWDYELTPVIGVFFCNFKLNELEEKPVTHISLTDDMTKRTIDNLTRYVFIQLPFFKNVEEECDTECDKWISSCEELMNK